MRRSSNRVAGRAALPSKVDLRAATGAFRPFFRFTRFGAPRTAIRRRPRIIVVRTTRAFPVLRGMRLERSLLLSARVRGIGPTVDNPGNQCAQGVERRGRHDTDGRRGRTHGVYFDLRRDQRPAHCKRCREFYELTVLRFGSKLKSDLFLLKVNLARPKYTNARRRQHEPSAPPRAGRSPRPTSNQARAPQMIGARCSSA